ncbi:MAG: DHH family phosphoesterase, partial [Thaumarchaeota archaeon]|nr:DHH family phosphoesterase [Nitrososphaerota archaeon]
MADLEGLLARYRVIATEITKTLKRGKRTLIVTHIDADGLCSGSIVFASLMRKGANVTLRTVPDLDRKTITALEEEKYDFYIFTDLASTLIAELESTFGGRFLVIDHHQIPTVDAGKSQVMNAWNFGYDGGREACSSSMAYFFAVSLDPSNGDLSPLAVVGALADRQDAV